MASLVRRLPASSNRWSPAAVRMREAAASTALSWLKIERHRVSRTTADAKSASTVRTGLPGK